MNKSLEVQPPPCLTTIGLPAKGGNYRFDSLTIDVNDPNAGYLLAYTYLDPGPIKTSFLSLPCPDADPETNNSWVKQPVPQPNPDDCPMPTTSEIKFSAPLGSDGKIYTFYLTLAEGYDLLQIFMTTPDNKTYIIGPPADQTPDGPHKNYSGDHCV